MVLTQARPIDQEKVDQLTGQMVQEAGGALSTSLIVIGDRLGLYKALAAAGPLSSTELASRTGTHERYIREWLAAQAAGGLVDYDPASGAYGLTPEQATILADDTSPAFVGGLMEIVAAVIRDAPAVGEAFTSGRGVAWSEHDPDVFEGTERFFQPGYEANIVPVWIPALDGVEAKLTAGATVADIGCGHGLSTILMAQAFPNSTFVGFDSHPGSIDTARSRAKAAGVADRVTFEVATAKTYPGTGYGVVAMFDCLHHMGDAIGAARHVRESLAPDGTWFVVEPLADDRVEANLHPLGRVYYAFSTLVCVPDSLAQEVGIGLGAQAGEARIRDVAMAGGFSRFRRAAEGAINLVFEARP
jgi:2-polyprenyl-3-methyl-5-hydroxy-6-metoxy-1,4-benzoquinol methylase